MSIPKSPSYAAKWKAKRQNRVKPTGMTKLLEKWDAKWKNYDRKRFESALGVGGIGLADMQMELETLRKAEAEISDLEKANTRAYDKDEKAVVKQILDDVADEMAYWKERKKSYVLEAANAKVAEGKLQEVAAKLDDAAGKAAERGKQLAKLHGALSAAENHRDADRRQPPALIEKFRASVDDFESMLREIEARDAKLAKAVDAIGKAHKDNDDMAALVKKLDSGRTATGKQLHDLWNDHATWKRWADEQLAASPT
jgi:DNA repair exonuclease SbcCD ATPase subunit